MLNFRYLSDSPHITLYFFSPELNFSTCVESSADDTCGEEGTETPGVWGDGPDDGF